MPAMLIKERIPLLPLKEIQRRARRIKPVVRMKKVSLAIRKWKGNVDIIYERASPQGEWRPTKDQNADLY